MPRIPRKVNDSCDAYLSHAINESIMDLVDAVKELTTAYEVRTPIKVVFKTSSQGR